MRELHFSINDIKDFKIALKKIQGNPIEIFWMSTTYFLNSGVVSGRGSYITNTELMKIRSLIQLLKEQKTSLKYISVNVLGRMFHPNYVKHLRNTYQKPYYVATPLLYMYPISDDFDELFEDELLHCTGEIRVYDTRWKTHEQS